MLFGFIQANCIFMNENIPRITRKLPRFFSTNHNVHDAEWGKLKDTEEHI